MIEPIVEERFEYKGFPCVVLFMPMGYRCGYVGLPKWHKYYGKAYDLIPISCHGGLTYSENDLYGQDDKNTYWIGFDCGHYNDGYDFNKAEEYYGDNKEAMKFINSRKEFTSAFEHSTTCTLEYCKEDCRRIVDQLIDMEG